MTKAFEIRRASPANPPKSGCGVPPPVIRPQVDDFPSEPYSRSVGVSPTFSLSPQSIKTLNRAESFDCKIRIAQPSPSE
jgi:hypothetical protein